MKKLAEDIDNTLNEEIGSPLEKRGFKTHLTVARSKGKFEITSARNAMEEYAEIIRNTAPILEVSTFELISSTLTPEGPVYETLEIFQLGG